MRLSTIIGALLWSFATSAVSQEPATPDDHAPIDLGEVIVEGRPLETQSRDFVDAVANSATHRGLARWYGPTCIGVINFRREIAEVIADTMVEIADEFSVPVNVESCEPNIYIIGAVDAQQVAEAWVRERPYEFRPRLAGLRSSELRPSMSSLELFKTASTPIRWYSLSQPRHHLPLGYRSPRQARAFRVDDLWRVFVIVDIDEVTGFSIRSICEFLSLVVFSQIDMDLDTAGVPSVLNMFSGGDANFTEWDRAYISELYRADSRQRLDRGEHAANIARAIGAERNPSE